MDSHSIHDGVGASPAEVEPKPRELDLFAFAFLLLSNLRFILACGLAAFLIMVGVMLHAKPRYASTAVMIVPQDSSTKASLLEAQLSGKTLDLLGGGYVLYGDILKSHTIADHLIRDFNLEDVYGAKDLPATEQVLDSMTKVEIEPEGLIRVSVQDTNSQRAADLANDYLHQLDILNSQLTLTSVSRERAYLQREMVNEKNALADAEVALKEAQESISGLPPEAEANAALSALETTRVQLRADQVRLGALLQSETASNPEVIRLKAEIAELSGQLNALQHGSSSAQTGTPTSKVPEETLLYTRRLRDVKFNEEIYDLLEKEFADAQQQEAENPSIVEVLDPAVPALHKAWPPRTLYCVIAGFIGILLGILLVSLRTFILVYTTAPRNAGKLQQIQALYRKQLRLKV